MLLGPVAYVLGEIEKQISDYCLSLFFIMKMKYLSLHTIERKEDV